MDRNWFEMKRIRERQLENSVWIPLRQSKSIERGSFGTEGHCEEFSGFCSLLIPLSLQEQAESLNWTEMVLRDHMPFIDGAHYCPTEIHQFGPNYDFGVEPVLVQNFPNGDPVIWHLNQDIVFALSLLREEDIWIRPNEMYTEVVRLKRNNDNKPILIEIKLEFMRDYLSARNMALRVSKYVKRVAILSDVSKLGWVEGNHSETVKNNKFEISVRKIHEGGHFWGSSAAVIHIARNDVDSDDDVPVMGPENDTNIDSISWTKGFSGAPLYHVMGEFWSNEWIQPAEYSLRVRQDDIPSSCEFIISASGNTMNADDLNDKDIGRWLWFRSEVIEAVLECRGSSFGWYTQDTGHIGLCPSYSVPFGINNLQLVTVYAVDIARLPEWQKRLWAGYNISPEGGVSEELLASQVRAEPANTQAPEEYLKISMEQLDVVSKQYWGENLFRLHRDINAILPTIHRFRAKNNAGLLALAKDITRIVIDRLDIDVLRRIIRLPADNKHRSLKLLENALSEIVGVDEARTVVAPLFGIYELRLGDAHLPSSGIQEAFNLIPVQRDAHSIKQGLQVIQGVVVTLQKISEIISKYEQISDRK